MIVNSWPQTCSIQADSIGLQKDLDTVTEYASHWQMQFNIKKCKVVHFGKRNLGFMYSMEGHCLENVEYEKDLGVVMSKDLKVVQRQCQESYSMANRMLGLISRTFKYKNQEVLLNLYKSMMHPHLEYCCTVWSPHYMKDKQMLEKVQQGRAPVHTYVSWSQEHALRSQVRRTWTVVTWGEEKSSRY